MILSEMHHPRSIKIHGYSEDPDVLYIVTEPANCSLEHLRTTGNVHFMKVR
jgi:hypothetical protein